MKTLHPIAMLLACACIIIAEQTCAQDKTNVTDKIVSFPTRFIYKVCNKTSRLEENIVTKSNKLLSQLVREEKRLQKKLHKKDSLLAKQLFPDVQTQYQAL